MVRMEEILYPDHPNILLFFLSLFLCVLCALCG
jgi:hypothetical protein